MSLTKVSYSMINGAPVNVLDFGATGNGTTDDTAAIQLALDSDGYAPVYFPAGIYKVTGSGTACLTLSKNRMIFGDGRASVIRADSAGASTDIFKIAFTDNGGYLDVRNFVMRDLIMFTNVGGRHALLIDGNSPNLPVLNATFDNLNLSGTESNYGRSIVMYGCAFSTIQNCDLGTGFSGFNLADGNRILNNLISGTAEGIGLDIQFGSYETIIANNAIVCRDGAIVVTNGSQVKILNNQMEQNGVNASFLQHMVFIQGLDYQCTDIDIIGNNFGGGTNLANSLLIVNGSDIKISKNRFNVTTNTDILFAAGSSYNYVYFDNDGTGGTRNSNCFNLIISDSGEGNFGVLKITSGASTGGYDPMKYYKDPNTCETVLMGASGGATTTTTVLVTLPVGFKPSDTYLLPCGSAGGVFMAQTSPTTGSVTFTTACPNNSNVGTGLRFLAKRGT